MTTLDLTQPEIVELKEILDNKATALEHELSHTDDRSYRVFVKEKMKMVGQLQAKLDAALAQGLPQHAGSARTV